MNVVDVIDMEDPNLGSNREIFIRRDAPVLGYQPNIIRLYGMCNGVAQMVTEIIRNAPQGGIDVLRLWSHGWSGGMNVSTGLNAQAGADHRSAIWIHNIGSYANDLRRLRRYFARHGRIELKGCSVASGPDGERLVVSLASTVGVSVRAGVDVQGGPGVVWAPGITWNGPVIESDASGALQCVDYSVLSAF